MPIFIAPALSRRIDSGQWHTIEEAFNFFGIGGEMRIRVSAARASEPRPLLRLNSSLPPWVFEKDLAFDQIESYHRWGNFFKAQILNRGDNPIFIEINPPT